MSRANDGRVGLAHESFTLHLDKVIKYGGVGPTSVDLQFTYYWDFVRNMGLAHLVGFDTDRDAPLPLVLHPAGIEGYLAFMGADWDTPVKFPGGEIVLYRVWLMLNLKTGARSASVMLGKEGETIIATQNDDDATAVKTLAYAGQVSGLGK